jgi:hypothetical protein
MGPLLYMLSVVGGNVVMRRIPAYIYDIIIISKYFKAAK